MLPNPTPVEGEVRLSQAQDQPSVTIHVRVGNRVVSHSFDVVSKMYKHIIYSHFSPAQYQKRYLSKSLIVFVVTSDVLNFHGHSHCPCNVARRSVLHYDRIAHVNIQGKS